jgi:hypothetical protein
VVFGEGMGIIQVHIETKVWEEVDLGRILEAKETETITMIQPD